MVLSGGTWGKYQGRRGYSKYCLEYLVSMAHGVR